MARKRRNLCVIGVRFPLGKKNNANNSWRSQHYTKIETTTVARQGKEEGHAREGSIVRFTLWKKSSAKRLLFYVSEF